MFENTKRLLSLASNEKIKILITGATGLLGKLATEKIIILGNEITGLALNDELDFLLMSKKSRG